MNLSNSTDDPFDGLDESAHPDAAFWYYIVLGVLGSAITTENILVLVAVCINKKLQEKDNFCIINVACADLLVGVVFMVHFPFTTIVPNSCTNITYCAVVYTPMPATILASVFSLMVMSIDRYISVSRPLDYANIVTMKRIILTVSTQWVVAILLAALPVILWKGDPAGFEGCVITELISNTKAVYLWYFLIIFLPTVVLLVLYGRLFCVAYRHARRVAPLAKQSRMNASRGCEISTINLPSGTRQSITTTQTSETVECARKKLQVVNRAYKATITLGIIMICMVFTFIPTQVMFVKFTCDSCIPFPSHHLRTLLLCAQVSNSAINPLIYAIRMKEIRRTFCRIFRTIFCCRRCCKAAAVSPGNHGDGKTRNAVEA